MPIEANPGETSVDGGGGTPKGDYISSESSENTPNPEPKSLWDEDKTYETYILLEKDANLESVLRELKNKGFNPLGENLITFKGKERIDGQEELIVKSEQQTLLGTFCGDPSKFKEIDGVRTLANKGPMNSEHITVIDTPPEEKVAEQGEPSEETPK